jgi:spore coat polysaccharide biosynthesis protein SpsF (cytidylyltransferase family)/sialic acid synthase SpsE
MNKPVLIAEIANTHVGSIRRLLKILDEIKKTPVTNVKFQLYSGRDICSINHPRRDHFEKQSFNSLEWKQAIDYAKELKFDIHADIFGFDALEIALENDIKSFKIHSSDTLNIPLLREISQVSGSIFLSCGGTYIGEILEAVYEIERYCSSDCKIVLMHGYQSYPSPINTTALNRLCKLQQIFGSEYLYGYMDHVDGGTDDAIYFPLLALPFKVNYIEKHVTINRSEKLTDFYSSIEAHDLCKFDGVVTNYTEAFDPRPFRFSEQEKHYRQTTKKQWHISERQTNNSQIDAYNVYMQRPSVPSNGQLHFSQIQASRLGHDKPIAGEVVPVDAAINAINIVVVARTSSKRLPRKALIKLPNGDETVLFLLKKLEIGLQEKEREYRICLATSDDSSDDELAAIVISEGFKVYRGSQSDVLQRIICASSYLGPSRFTIRITGDDLLIDTDYLDKMSSYAILNDYDYCENKILPSGMEVEIFKNNCLAQLQRAAVNRDATEYLTFFIRDNNDLFHTGEYTDEYLLAQRALLSSIRLTVDYPEDLDRVSSIIQRINKVDIYSIGVKDIVSLATENKNLFDITDKHKVKGLNVNTALNIEMLKHKPLVTIYIVSCNYGCYAENAIKSVFGQTFTQYSLYLVDNNSDDNTSEVFQHYSNIQGAHTVSLNNGVLHEANNYVLNNCKTKYIMRLDADDELEKHALELMVSKLESIGNMSYCTCDYYLMDEDRVIYGQEYRFKLQERSINDIAPHGACTLFNADHIRRQGGYSQNVTCQDGFDMLLKLNREGRGTHVNLPLFRYRKHPDSLSSHPARLQKARSTLLHGQAALRKIDTPDWAVMFLREAEMRLITDSLRVGIDDHPVRLVKTLMEIFPDRVILSISSPVDDECSNELKTSLGIQLHVRSSGSSRQSTPIEKSVLEVLQYASSAQTLTIASLCYPFIQEHSIRSCKESIWAFGADRSITVLRRQRNSFRLSREGLEPITSVRSLKNERDIVFEEAGGVHTVLTSSFFKNASLYTGKATPVEISDYEAIRSDTELFSLLTGST